MKLTTPEQKLIELAKMDGYISKEDRELKGWIKPDGTDTIEFDLPKYLTSYDAIIPLIQKQDNDIQWHIEVHTGMRPHRATPTQLCDALLWAKGFEV